MGSAYEENIKKTRVTEEGRPLKCKCGSIRFDVFLLQDDDDRWDWINVFCRACGEHLYHHGA